MSPCSVTCIVYQARPGDANCDAPRRRNTAIRRISNARPCVIIKSCNNLSDQSQQRSGARRCPRNGPIFATSRLQPWYNPTTRHLQILRNFRFITPVVSVLYKNHKNCERFQCPVLAPERVSSFALLNLSFTNLKRLASSFVTSIKNHLFGKILDKRGL